MTSREKRISEAFVSLTDVFARDVDPTVLLDRLVAHCTALAGADAAGVMMTDSRGNLRTLAVSDQRAGLLEVVQAQSGEGPCSDAWHSSASVSAPDLSLARDRWPRFAHLALDAGFRGAYAVPVRVHGQVVGALGLLNGRTAGERAELALAQAFADVTAVALVQWRADHTRPQDVLTLVQAAVSAKATVETAKGMLAAHSGRSVAESGTALHHYCTVHLLSPVEVAHALVRRTLEPEAVMPAQRVG
ncbi:GAF domain-containing protein [Streptomyces sp. NPDC004111]|uniref:GAF domain-containing protein n=1 Tax=Streptomyces sp. NPDC004111 TaxID=3364690 RepID=UPI0036CA3325